MAFETYAARATQETPVPSLARIANGNTGTLTAYGIASMVRAQLNVTAASGTTPTLNVVIEDSIDNGANWNTVGTFAQKTAAGREVVNVTAPFGNLLRVRWTIAGAIPSFTFAVDWFIE